MDAPTVIVPSDILDDEDRISGRTHNLPDEFIVPRLDVWMHAEYTLKHHTSWLCVLTKGGKYKYWSPHKVTDPDEERRRLIREILYTINRFAHYNGAWVGGYYGLAWPHLWLLWKDSDGDIQTYIDTEGQSYSQYSQRTMDAWRMNADAAIETWCEVQGIRVNEIGLPTIKRAQGQKPDDIVRWQQLDREINL
jgi:hypothetical protein